MLIMWHMCPVRQASDIAEAILTKEARKHLREPPIVQYKTGDAMRHSGATHSVSLLLETPGTC